MDSCQAKRDEYWAGTYKFCETAALFGFFNEPPKVKRLETAGERSQIALSVWYVAAIGDSQVNTLRLPMKFLAPGVKYEATIYTDDPHVNTATHIAIGHRVVTNADVLQLKLASRGGEAIYLSPAAGSR